MKYLLIYCVFEFRTILRNSGSPRYLHSAVILNDVMLVFGGNTHNDTSVSFGAKCYSTDFLAYDISKGTYTIDNMQKDLPGLS